MSADSPLRCLGSVVRGRYLVTLPNPASDPKLADQVMIVTGANAGLGFEACLHLSRIGLGKLVMGVRTLAKGKDAKTRILASTHRPDTSIEVWHIDMDDYGSIEAFAKQATALPRLDGVLANAGIMTPKFSLSEGSESTLNVNVISTFLLYSLLAPAMIESGRQTGHLCRFSIVNSALHLMAPLAELKSVNENVIERLNDPKRADMANRYALTKLLVLFAVREIAARSSAKERPGCIINTPNPSFCHSGLLDAMEPGLGMRVYKKLMARTTEEGSRTLVHGLLAGGETNGQYLCNCAVEIPAKNVVNDWGRKFQQKFFKDLVAKLETIQPGSTASI
ncbi:hypothetical protein ANO11243_056220 [Dothideomycetidae sp. 11243]|nr:hypothetical protein ANO11243_056220 [fungal sp. No.11243]